MAQSEIKRTTIVREHVKRLVLGIAVGILVCLLMNQLTGFIMDSYFEQSGYYKAHDEQYVQSLQGYAQKHNVTTDDTYALEEWGKKQGDLFFQIYEDDQLIFQYYNSDSQSFREAATLNYLEWASSYPVQFTDGTFQVIFFGNYYYKTFNYLMMIDVAVAFIVFLIIFLSGVQKRTRYIRQLRDEIEILGGGDLDYEITIKGNDELAELADNLDQMRQALRHHIEEEARLMEERQTVMTQLSHDIRTPLTSMNLFADLLKRGEYEDEVQRNHYLDRIQENASNLTNLAEELFFVSKDQVQTLPEKSMTVDKETSLEEEEPNLIQVLTDAAEALRLSGFLVQENYIASTQALPMERQSFTRVLDNITANIMRYADPREPVCFSYEEHGDTITITFENRKCDSEEIAVKGSGIGLKNVNMLVQQQGGTVQIDEQEQRFLIRITFPKKI